MNNHKRIVVTGAGGYIGRFVVKKLLDAGHFVYTVDRRNRQIDERAKSLNVDIFSEEISIYDQLERPDVCIHLAWQDGFVHNAPSHLENLHAHYKFLTNMVEGGLPHLAVMGTVHEVGYFEGAIDEDTPTNPHSLYGIAKNSLRQALTIFLKDKNTVFQWLRAYYIIGDDLNNNSIFTKIIRAEQENKEKFPFNTGRNKYDFVDVEELAEQIALCVVQTEVTGIINCCSGQPTSLKDKVENFIRQHEFRIRLDYGAFPDRPYDSPAIWGDNRKIEIIKRNSELKIYS
jgi:Nucleoside-diphosphate-sugar epimerases